ncbi:MAG: 30S ribosomal protein S8, partial [Cyanobacteria bacterium REEB65]|nr:30S ribosomal protein S8 [Cyanobacteria bacterium REEB65]
MPITDPIADLLTRIRNASTAFKPQTEVPHSKVKAEIARVLLEEGYIAGAEDVTDDAGHPRIKVTLKYVGDKRRSRVITGIRRISKPGLRVYKNRGELPRVLGGLGI